MPFVSRTRATFRSAEFGFFGVTVKTRVQTPRFCGAPRSAGVFVFALGTERPFRTSWLTVGKSLLLDVALYAQKRPTGLTALSAGPRHDSSDDRLDRRRRPGRSCGFRRPRLAFREARGRPERRGPRDASRRR